MTEKLFFDSIKRDLPQVHWCRIENAAGTGMPDVNACYMGREFWWELKILNSDPLLRRSQVAWMTARHEAGGRVFVVGLDPVVRLTYIFRPRFKKLVTAGEGYVKLLDKPIWWGNNLENFVKHFC